MCIRDRSNIVAREYRFGGGKKGNVAAKAIKTLTTSVSGIAVSYTHLRAHETPEHLVCRLLLEKKKKKIFFFFFFFFFFNDTATTEIYTRSLVGSVRCV